MKYFALFVSIIIGLSSCTDDSTRPQILKKIPGWGLEASGSIQIALDSISSSIIFQSKIEVVNDTPFLTFYDIEKNAIEAYEVNNFTLTKDIVLDNDEMFSACSNNNFVIHNWDSIFIIGGESDQIHIVSETGKVLQSREIDLPNNQKVTVDNFYTPFFHPKTSTIGLWVYPDISPDKLEFYQNSKNVELSIVGKQVSNTYGGFPDDHKQEDIFFTFNTIGGYKSGEFIINHFSKSHVVNIYNYTDKSLHKSIYAKSKFLPEYLPPLLKNGDKTPDAEEMHEYIIKGGNYMGMFSNQDNSLHFRVVEHSKEYTDDIEFSYRPFWL